MNKAIQYGRWLTAVTMIFGCAGFLLYDIWVLNVHGPDTTISAVVNAWVYSYMGERVNPMACWLFGFVNGAFVVHFLKWGVKLDGPAENSNLKDEELDADDESVRIILLDLQEMQAWNENIRADD